MSTHRAPVLPDAGGTRFVTDGGLETDLIFHHGVDLPEFAAFPLVDSDAGRELLISYYDGYAAIARDAGVGLILETPTWRANPDWGARLGFGADELSRVNTDAVTLMAGLRARYAPDVEPILISGAVGPRGDGYSATDRSTADEAADYHQAQLAHFAAAGADLATAYTLTHVEEAIGIVRAARSVDLPIAISFTVETDGRLPSGATMAEAIATVDLEAPPNHYLINCAHPSHIRKGIDPGAAWTHRILGIRANASLKNHAELDAAEELDEGDIAELVAAQTELDAALPAVVIVGGCCGTDHRHVEALWR